MERSLPSTPNADRFRWWPWPAAALSGALLALCYPPFDLAGFVWIWQAPLLAALWFSDPKRSSTPRWRRGALLGYVAGVCFFLIDVFWITEISRVAGAAWVGIGALVGMAGYLGFYFALFGAFAATVGRWTPSEPKKEGRDLFGQSLGVLRAAFLNGAAWCGLEWLRGIVFTGFGWNGLGVALSRELTLVQFADVIGITGYGFVLMFAGAVAFCTLVRLWREICDRRRLRPHLDFAVAVALIIGLFLYGLLRLPGAPEESVDVRARIMQLNIPLEEKWTEDRELQKQIVYDYRDLTRAFVETSEPDLVLWPETALPGHFNFPWVQDYFNDHVLRGDDFHLLTGLEDSSLEGEEIYNTVTLMRGSTDSYQMYKKIHLVPFGEYVPFRHSFPLFEWIAGGIITNDFTPGTSYEPLTMEKAGHEIGIVPLICFEDTVPRHVRRFLRPEPQILVNVTNDGWFYDSAESVQHFRNALFRCIEFRRPMIRAANTGVSAFVDTRGSLYDRDSAGDFPRILRDAKTGSIRIRGSLPGDVEVDLDPPMTLYARFGDTFSIALGSVALGWAIARGIASRVRYRRTNRS